MGLIPLERDGCHDSSNKERIMLPSLRHPLDERSQTQSETSLAMTHNQCKYKKQDSPDPGCSCCLWACPHSHVESVLSLWPLLNTYFLKVWLWILSQLNSRIKAGEQGLSLWSVLKFLQFVVFQTKIWAILFKKKITVNFGLNIFVSPKHLLLWVPYKTHVWLVCDCHSTMSPSPFSAWW